jgi:hypothetical protein
MITEHEFERWKQLSNGLAHSYQSRLTPRRYALLLAEVEYCIDCVTCNGLDTISDWDGHDGESVGDRVDDYLWDSRYQSEKINKNGDVEVVCGNFGTMLSACVRAGFDMAVEPSAGVLGFTVGDLIDAFDGEIPDWVSQRFHDKDALLSAGREDGVWL